jgi:hypothetical protein
MSEPHATTIAGAVTGTAGLTFPLWNDAVTWLTGANQVMVAIGGIIVLTLTALKLWTEYKLARRRLRDAENEGR